MASLDQLHDLDVASGTSVLKFHRRTAAMREEHLATRGDELFTRPLERVRAAVAADHLALVRWHDADEHAEIAAAVGVPVTAPGMLLAFESSSVLARAYARGVSSTNAVDDDGPLERLVAAAGMETAMAVPLDGTVNGALYAAWADTPAPVEAVERAVTADAAALAALLDPPAVLGAQVVICHPDRLVAEGIARQAERRLSVVAHPCADVEDLLHAVEGGRPDLIACSEALGEGEALAAVAAQVRAAGSAAPVLALARAETPRSISDALRAGIAGYVAVSEGPERILEVMAAVLDGRAVLPAQSSGSTTPDLTSREQEVLEGLDRGLSYVAIANELQVAPSTVKSHARQLFRKLDVGSSTAALHRARSEGLL